ncbi:MAG: DUF58 domain-containing protein, partial [Syntrophaceae bacterium]|nr:DUF58 domain-containing protein [Syntrophaceae bacterium]
CLVCTLSIDKQRFFPGETLRIAVTVGNRKWLPIWLQAWLPHEGFVIAPDGVAALRAETGLLWHQQGQFHWFLTAQRRGIHRLGPLTIQTGDLFGFFPQIREVCGANEVIVYPRLVAIKPLAVPRRDLFGLPGGKNPVKDPVYLLGTRDYQHGRPAKHIHWKATARHHRLQEKLFEPSAQEKILLVLDCSLFSGPEGVEAFETLLSLVASSAVQLAGRGCAVGLATNGRMTGQGSPFLSVSRSPGQLIALLELLARLQREPVRDMLSQLRLHPQWPAGISGLYFSRKPDEMLQLVTGFFAQRRIPLRFYNQNQDNRLVGSANGNGIKPEALPGISEVPG